MKTTILILSLIFSLSAFACGESKSTKKKSNSDTTQTSESTKQD